MSKWSPHVSWQSDQNPAGSSLSVCVCVCVCVCEWGEWVVDCKARLDKSTIEKQPFTTNILHNVHIFCFVKIKNMLQKLWENVGGAGHNNVNTCAVTTLPSDSFIYIFPVFIVSLSGNQTSRSEKHFVESCFLIRRVHTAGQSDANICCCIVINWQTLKASVLVQSCRPAQDLSVSHWSVSDRQTRLTAQSRMFLGLSAGLRVQTSSRI